MLRIFKTYDFPLHNPLVKTRFMSYSARPGDLESKDDFYILDQRMVVIESSLANYNKTLYNYILSKALPVWMRVNVANRLASTTSEWIHFFTLHNSGTHNNQWAIVNYETYRNYIKKGISKDEWTDVVWLVEQFFFLAEKMDVTKNFLVNQSYFATYNFPYHQNIYDLGDFAQNDPHDPREDIIRFF